MYKKNTDISTYNNQDRKCTRKIFIYKYVLTEGSENSKLKRLTTPKKTQGINNPRLANPKSRHTHTHTLLIPQQLNSKKQQTLLIDRSHYYYNRIPPDFQTS